MATINHTGPHADGVVEALQRQQDGDAHDRGLIVERLAWTPEQRLDAHAAFLRCHRDTLRRNNR
jgi:hypothetical protein